MATQAQAGPIPRWENNKASPGGIVGQITTLITRPKAFFQKMPHTRQWLWIGLLVLFIAGFTASNQVTQQSNASASTAQQAGSSALSTQATSNANAQTTSSAGSSTAAAITATTASTTQQTSSVDANTTLMSGLLAACGVLVMWAGQTVLLCLVTMLQAYAPNIGRSLQVAVWASLPLALMLILRQLNFAMGGTGGSVGLSLLLTQWDGYAKLAEPARRVLAVFMSNISLFWLWNLVLLYFGARYALRGNRLSVMLIVVMWIAAAAVVPVLVGNPVTTTGPRTTTSVSTQQRTTNSSSTTNSTTTNQQQPGLGGVPGSVPGSGVLPPSGASGSTGSTNPNR